MITESALGRGRDFDSFVGFLVDWQEFVEKIS